MGISIDSTFAVQIVSFVVLWFCLRRLLFQPVLDVLEQRAARTQGNREVAGQLSTEAAGLRHEYEARLRAVRRAVVDQAEAERKAALEEERTVIAAARDAAGAHLNRTRVDIGAQLEAARTTLRAGAADLAARVADKVLGRGVP